MSELFLAGCTPTPLAFYLKALGIFRITVEQRDPNARAAWRNDSFVLDTKLNREDLIDFFANQYEPTPIVAPWNGGSGFYLQEGKLKEKDPESGKRKKTGIRNQETVATKTVAKIAASQLERLGAYREVIGLAKTAIEYFGIEEAPKEGEKMTLLTYVRNRFPDDFVKVLDSAFVILSDKVVAPPLLGTGLNDGNLDFSNNFMQRIAEVFGLDSPNSRTTKLSPNWLANALFADPVEDLAKSAIGQFNPYAAGGANASTGFESDSLINPWDFILMMEGALLFAGGAVKRLGSTSGQSMAYPFCVKHSGTGFGTSTLDDEDSSIARGEMWMPLWIEFASCSEITALFGEGRSEIRGRTARNGIDFFQASVMLGTARGISEFQRYGLLKRFGKNYFAIPLDRIRTSQNPEADLLAEIMGWLDQFRRQATKSSPKPPSSMTRALRRIEDGIIRFCKQPESSHVQQLLIAFGEGEKSLADSFRWTKENYLRPLFGLSPRWIELADDGTPEFRLAASLASLTSRFGKEWVSFRHHLEPINSSQSKCWWGEESDRRVVWNDGELTRVLNRIFQRRLLLEQGVAFESVRHFVRIPADLGDVSEFIEGRVDENRIAKLIWALSLIDFRKRVDLRQRSVNGFAPPSFYSLLKLCYPWRVPGSGDSDVPFPLVPMIHRRAADGQGTAASRLACRRLRASGFAPALREIVVDGDAARRAAAALVFPLWHGNFEKLRVLVTRTDKDLTSESELILTETRS